MDDTEPKAQEVIVRTADSDTPQGPNESISSTAGAILRGYGIRSQLLKVGLIVWTALNSARSGDPLSVVLTETDGANATSILNICMRMTPKSSILEFTELPSKTLFKGGPQFRGKAIVSFDSGGFKRGFQNLAQLLERGRVVSHQPPPGKEQSSGLQQHEVEGPIALVTIARDPKDPILTLPFILRLHLTSDPKSQTQRLMDKAKPADPTEQSRLILESALLVKRLEKLTDNPVVIPFADQLLKALDSRIQDFETKVDLIFRLLKNIARINALPLITQEDIMSDYLRIDKSVISQFLLSDSGQEVKLLPGVVLNPQAITPSTGPLTVTKEDYYILWLLMDGTLPSVDEFLTERQQGVFEAIKQINLAYFKGKTFIDPLKDPEAEVLKTLHDPGNIGAWADRVAISNTIAAAIGMNMSESTLYAELRDLLKKKLLESVDDPASKNKKVYAVARLNPLGFIRLPHPSKIDAQQIQVVNPITGSVDTI